MPSEFSRLRYYYGQLLAAADLADEQAYHAGKQYFHNTRLHGSGVICGLTARRVPPTAEPAGPATTLRVTRGAAIDACGREILVPVEHCIDVNVWLHQNRARLAALTPPVDRPSMLWLALRYRECPSDPLPASRDACGCDAGSCQFARVRESFELALLTEKELGDALNPRPPFPFDAGAADPQDPAASPSDAISALAGADCPQPCRTGWLVLASIKLVLSEDATPRVIDLEPPDNTPPARRTLLSTAALQDLVLHFSSAVSPLSPQGPGPRIAGVALAPDAGGSPDPTMLRVTVKLARLPGEPPAVEPQPIALGAVTPNNFFLSLFDPAAWTPFVATTATLTPGPAGSDEAAIDLQFGAPADILALAENDRFRLVIDQSESSPIADEAMRSLRPLKFVAAFKVVKDSAGLLALQPLPL